MKTIDRPERPSSTIPIFRMTSSEFISTLKSVVTSDSAVELTTGSYFDNKRYIFESIDEIEQNAAKICTPFELKINSFKAEIGRVDAIARFEECDRILSDNLLRQLEEYKPFGVFLIKPWFPAVFLNFLLLSVLLLTDWSI